MRELHTLGELVAACGDDALCLWVSQGMTGSARAWADGTGPEARPGTAAAVAVACADLSERDRIAVWGEPEAAARLVGGILPEVGATFRPLGEHGLIAGLCRRRPELELAKTMGWMSGSVAGAEPGMGTEPGVGTEPGDGADGGGGGVGWLAEEDMAAVGRLLDEAFPGSHAYPGRAGVRRWAGIRAADGRLAAVAADAWSAPTVGLLAGVAVDAEFRGAGLAGRVCRFVLDDLCARHGRAALMVEAWNAPAISLYRRLGLGYAPSAAARVIAA